MLTFGWKQEANSVLFFFGHFVDPYIHPDPPPWCRLCRSITKSQTSSLICSLCCYRLPEHKHLSFWGTEVVVVLVYLEEARGWLQAKCNQRSHIIANIFRQSEMCYCSLWLFNQMSGYRHYSSSENVRGAEQLQDVVWLVKKKPGWTSCVTNKRRYRTSGLKGSSSSTVCSPTLIGFKTLTDSGWVPWLNLWKWDHLCKPIIYLGSRMLDKYKQCNS